LYILKSNLHPNLPQLWERGVRNVEDLSYTESFKHDVVGCANEMVNIKLLQILELMNTTLNCGGNTGQQSARQEITFPESDYAVFHFSREMQDWN
jgi:hypothetical protein